MNQAVFLRLKVLIELSYLRSVHPHAHCQQLTVLLTDLSWTNIQWNKIKSGIDSVFDVKIMSIWITNLALMQNRVTKQMIPIEMFEFGWCPHCGMVINVIVIYPSRGSSVDLISEIDCYHLRCQSNLITILSLFVERSIYTVHKYINQSIWITMFVYNTCTFSLIFLSLFPRIHNYSRVLNILYVICVNKWWYTRTIQIEFIVRIMYKIESD